MFKPGDKLEVEWRIKGKLIWWPAEVVKVTPKRCTIRYEARPPAFKESFEEVHLLVDGCLVENGGVYGVLPFRRVGEEEATEEEEDSEEEEDEATSILTTTEEELSSEEEDEEWNVDEAVIASASSEESLSDTSEESYVDSASSSEESSDEMSVVEEDDEEKIVRKDKRDWLDLRRRQHAPFWNDQYRPASGIHVLCDIIEHDHPGLYCWKCKRLVSSDSFSQKMRQQYAGYRFCLLHTSTSGFGAKVN
jgi:hypothetical protein